MSVGKDVRDFHRTFRLPVRDEPFVPDTLERGLRVRLQQEETDELATASIQGDVVGVADALADIVYIAYGTAAVYGIDLDAVLGEVHRSNMEKLPSCDWCHGSRSDCSPCGGTGKGSPVYRADGKVLKPEGWRPPDIGKVLGV